MIPQLDLLFRGGATGLLLLAAVVFARAPASLPSRFGLALTLCTVVGTLMSLQLETNVPMLSAVLTPHHFHEHVEHRKYFHAHFAVKGTEAADACIRTIESLRQSAALVGG